MIKQGQKLVSSDALPVHSPCFKSQGQIAGHPTTKGPYKCICVDLNYDVNCRKEPLDGAGCSYFPLITDWHCLKYARLEVDSSEVE